MASQAHQTQEQPQHPPPCEGRGLAACWKPRFPALTPQRRASSLPRSRGGPRSSPARVLAQGRPQEARSGEEKRGGLEGGVEHNQMHCMHAPVPRSAAYVPHGTAWPLPRAGGGCLVLFGLAKKEN